MRVVVQRVSRAKVIIEGKCNGEIGIGLMVLAAMNSNDNIEKIKWMCNKIINLRIFSDENDKMNLSVRDINGGILLISNFTLYGDAKKGFRPSFIEAAPQEISKPLYEQLVDYLKNNYTLQIETGIFGAMMDIDFVNSGPVTVIIDN